MLAITTTTRPMMMLQLNIVSAPFQAGNSPHYRVDMSVKPQHEKHTRLPFCEDLVVVVACWLLEFVTEL